MINLGNLPVYRKDIRDPHARHVNRTAHGGPAGLQKEWACQNRGPPLACFQRQTNGKAILLFGSKTNPYQLLSFSGEHGPRQAHPLQVQVGKRLVSSWPPFKKHAEGSSFGVHFPLLDLPSRVFSLVGAARFSAQKPRGHGAGVEGTGPAHGLGASLLKLGGLQEKCEGGWPLKETIPFGVSKKLKKCCIL